MARRVVIAALFAFILLSGLLPVNSIAFAEDMVITKPSDDENNPHKYTVDESGILTKYEGPGGALTIPAQVTSIGIMALQEITTITAVSFESGSLVKTVGIGAFRRCSNLESVDFTSANMLELINISAFDNCTSLTSLTFPASLTTLGNNAFTDCTSLSSITIPASITTLGTSIFPRCTSLENVFFYVMA
jgi:hypothetical protein